MNKYNRKIIDTKHSIDRFIQRYSNISRDRVEKVIDDAIEKIIKDYNDESTTYGVWSKSTGICVILDWRKDTQNKSDKNNNAVIITLPPIKKEFKDFHTTSNKDVRMIVESMLKSLIPISVFNESVSSRLIEMYSVDSLDIFIENNDMFDSGIAYCFEVK